MSRRICVIVTFVKVTFMAVKFCHVVDYAFNLTLVQTAPQ